MQVYRSILRWTAQPVMQAAATAHFASHVAGLRGQLLALMIGLDNLAWHHQVEADSLAQICYSEYHACCTACPRRIARQRSRLLCAPHVQVRRSDPSSHRTGRLLQTCCTHRRSLHACAMFPTLHTP